jgi:putative membrane protein
MSHGGTGFLRIRMNSKGNNMKTILNLLVQVILVCALLLSMSCASKNDSSKDVAEEQNDEKFETKNGEQDAQFLVDAVDASYTIINLSKIGRERGSRTTIDKAAEIQDGQTRILNELKEYAAQQVISVPKSGPEEIKDSQKDLYDEQVKFDEKWCRELITENEKLIKKFEEYSEKTDGNLKVVITRALPTLRSHEDKLQAYKTAVNN